MSGILYIISAPSGSGKTTLVDALRQYVPHLEFFVSYTTRPPRGSEQQGREYHFITRGEFEAMIARAELLEYADVFGNYYGTAKSALHDAARHGNDLLLDIDVQGASQVKHKMPDAVSIFVLPASRAELESRLRKRSISENVHSEEVIRRRLDTARKEIENYPNYDYILINDRLEQSVDELQAIVLGERIALRQTSFAARKTVRRNQGEMPEIEDGREDPRYSGLLSRPSPAAREGRFEVTGHETQRRI